MHTTERGSKGDIKRVPTQWRNCPKCASILKKIPHFINGPNINFDPKDYTTMQKFCCPKCRYESEPEPRVYDTHVEVRPAYWVKG